MRYGVSGKLKKWVALAVSIALVICTAPAVPALAAGTTEGAGILKQVSFGAVDGGLAAGVDKEKITLSIAPGVNESVTMANNKIGNEDPANATSWIFAEEASEKDMGASVKGEKIILVEGYDEKANYLSYSVKAEHNRASDVLTGASDVYSLISTEDNEILYYGKIDTDTKIDSTSSCFRIPKGLKKGNYNLYIFAEKIDTGSPKKIYTSKLGEPVKIEVVSSVGFEVTGLEEPEAGKNPDKKALLKIEKDNNAIEKNVDVTWQDSYGNEVTGGFGYNMDYTVYIDLEECITGYIFGENIAKINNKNAEFETRWNSASYTICRTYQTKQLDEVNISGSVGDDNKITLKAYTGITPPVTTNPEYTYEWWNDSETSTPVETGQSHVITDSDINSSSIIVKLDTASQNNVACKKIEIQDGFIETDIIEGVSKTDETVKGKSDGKIEGLTTDMKAELLVGGSSYSLYDNDKIEGLPAGTTYRIKIEKDGLIPSGLKGIYADYTIGEGSGTLAVSFDSKGGTSINTIDGIAYNEIITAPAEPVKEGYTFDGWYTDETGDTKWNFSEDRVVQDITLFARWSQNQTAKPADTQKPSITTAPDNTNTQKPPVTAEPGSTGTATPVSTATPQASSNPAQPYIPQPSSQVTAAPSQTETPVSTQEPPVQTQEPVQTQSPVQTQEPVTQPSSQPASSQTPAATQEPVPSQQPPAQTQEPVPSQIPAATPGANLPAGNPMPEGEKIVTGGTEYKVSGDGSATIFGIVATNKKDIKIPDTITVNGVTYKITAIEENAFAKAKKLTTVTIPSSVKTIGAGAFKNCKNLKEVKLPSSVTTIGKKAFKNCKKLKHVVIGKKGNNNKKVTRKRALRYGTNVAKVSIGASAFENCTDLRSVVINSQVTKIGNSTFRYCSQLRKMLVKSLKLKKVGNKALQGVNNCKITVPPVKLKPYTTLFKNKGQGKKVVVAKS